jgi:choline-sulfatase
MTSDAPNILFIQCDQLTAAMLGAYGNPTASTPHLDALAERGVVFDSAYTNFPLCAPSRFSMLSGQLTSNIGAYDNGAEFPSSVPTFAHYLRWMGYQTSLVGKMHFVGADQLHGFEERLTSDLYPADFGWTGDWTELLPEHANDARSFKRAGVCVRNVQLDYDDEVVHRAERKLYDLVRSEDQRPFFMLVSFTHPHDPYQCPQAYWDRYRHDDIPLPSVGCVDEADMDAQTSRLRRQTGLHGFEMTDDLLRTARHAYLGSVSYLDDNVGRLLEVLRQCDLDSNTTVVFTTDHGDMLGEHGLWYKKTFFEYSARIPLIVSSPQSYPSRRVASNVSLVDILPTLMELGSGGTAPETIEPIDGRSLCALMRGDDSSWDNVVLSEMLAESAVAPLVMLKRDNYKYIYSAPDPEQLFDLQADPLEARNLAGEPRHESVRASMEVEVKSRWDLETLTEQVLASQRRRLFLREVLAKGKRPDWDFHPHDEASKHCLRGGGVYNEWCYSDIVPLRNDLLGKYPDTR